MPRYFPKNTWKINNLYVYAGIFCAHLLTSQLGKLIFGIVSSSSSSSSASVILAPAGIAFAAVILYGNKALLPIALAILVNGYINSTLPAVLIPMVFGNVFQAFLAAYILNRVGFKTSLARMRDMAAILLVAIFVTPIGPTVVYFARELAGVPQPTSWAMLWLGGILSVTIFTTFIVRWLTSAPIAEIKSHPKETFLTFAALVASTLISFWTPYSSVGGFSFAIIQLAILAYIALRMGTGRMTLAFFIITITSLMGPFFGMVRPAAEELSKKISGIELYYIIFAVLYFTITAISEERDAALREFRIKNMELEAALKKINEEDKKKNDFISVLAHELRNPLAPIANYLEIMEMEGIGKTKFKQSADGIAQQTKNLSRLLFDLLDISRVMRGKISLQKEVTDLRSVVEKAVDGSRSRFVSAEQELTVNLPDNPVYSNVDAFRIEQILTNLLHNANKFTEVRGAVSVSLYTEGDNACVKVKDNGVGISHVDLSKIFEMFSQADTSATRRHSGLGIGLNLSRQLAQLHGGEIRAESYGPGQGSEFTVSMPLIIVRTGEQKESLRELVAGEKLPAGSAKKILIVDDNESLLISFVKMFRLMGYEVLSATNGPVALKLARDSKPDAVLLDIGMPGMSGYEVAKKLRSELKFTKKLIAVTGYGQKEDKRKAIEAGFDHHLTKPVAVSDIERLF